MNAKWTDSETRPFCVDVRWAYTEKCTIPCPLSSTSGPHIISQGTRWSTCCLGGGWEGRGFSCIAVEGASSFRGYSLGLLHIWTSSCLRAWGCLRSWATHVRSRSRELGSIDRAASIKLLLRQGLRQDQGQCVLSTMVPLWGLTS